MAARSDAFWSAVAKTLPAAAVLALCLGIVLLAARLNWQQVAADESVRMAVGLLRVFYAWSVIVTLLGLAQRFANHKSAALTYLTGAMFPYYILHQTLIVLVGYWFTMHRVPAALEAAAIIAATIIGCVAGYEIVRRIAVLRPLFGLPLRRREERGASPRVLEHAMR